MDIKTAQEIISSLLTQTNALAVEPVQTSAQQEYLQLAKTKTTHSQTKKLPMSPKQNEKKSNTPAHPVNQTNKPHHPASLPANHRP